jgi:hypothetical protein
MLMASPAVDLRPMPAGHVLLCCPSTAANDGVLREAAALYGARHARLSLVLPMSDEPLPRGCCGMGSYQWRRLVEEVARDAL